MFRPTALRLVVRFVPCGYQDITSSRPKLDVSDLVHLKFSNSAVLLHWFSRSHGELLLYFVFSGIAVYPNRTVQNMRLLTNSHCRYTSTYVPFNLIDDDFSPKAFGKKSRERFATIA